MTMNFRSKFEETVYNDAVSNGITVEFEPFKLEYTIFGRYLPDFVLPNNIIIEAKGYFDVKARAKMAAVKRCHPDLDIRFVFMDANKKLSKGSKNTYADWARKYGFLFAEGTIPAKWINEKPKEFKKYEG